MSQKEEMACWEALNSLFDAGFDLYDLSRTASRIQFYSWPKGYI